MTLKSIALLMMTIILGCSGPQSTAVEDTELGGDGGLTVVAVRPEITITNRTTQEVFVFVVGREALAAINWAPCIDRSRCEPLAPGASRRVPYPANLTGRVEREASVIWWRAIRGSDWIVRPGGFRSVVVTL